MEWEITVHKDQKYAEVVTKGEADYAGSIEMAKAIAKTMRRNRLNKALIDHRNVTSVSGSITEVYERPKIFKLIGVILGIKIAEVIKPEHKEHFKFMENVCLTNGYTISVFHDRKKALEWLLN